MADRAGRRRWPWAISAGAAGAAAGVAAGYVVRRLRRQDTTDDLDPRQLEAVVDRTPRD